jgi:hypothetical protein
MDEVQQPGISERYTPSSGRFRIYNQLMLLRNKIDVYSKSHRKQSVGRMRSFLTLKEVENIAITGL